MKSYLMFAVVAALTLAAWPGTATAANDEVTHGSTSEQLSKGDWWNIPYPQRFDASRLSREQSLLRVSGKDIVSEDGTPFVLRGMNIADPHKLSRQDRWSRRIFEEVASWGANVIRLPIHPIAWRKLGAEWYFERIDEAVVWANELDMYLIIDWHSIGNLLTGMYQHPMYETDLTETMNFWRSVAYRYKDVPTIAVAELFNEPTDNYMGAGSGSLGKLEWADWRETLEDIIDVVSQYDSSLIFLVAGFNWAYDLTPVADRPVRRENVAYASHPYPQKARPAAATREALFEAWHRDWGFVAASYPLILTEIGWVREDGYGAHVPVIHNDGTYGPNLVEFMDQRGISWTGWVFDPDWSPTMISDWDFTPTEQGEFFRQVMQESSANE